MTDQSGPGPEREPDSESPPLLRIVRGEPTDEELAALVAVISTRRASAAAAATARRASRPSEWAAHHRKHRQPHRPGPGAWQAAARPR